MLILPDCLVTDCFVAKSVLTKNYSVESILAASTREGFGSTPVGARPRAVRGMGWLNLGAAVVAAGGAPRAVAGSHRRHRSAPNRSRAKTA
jgi:hypothetical protein